MDRTVPHRRFMAALRKLVSLGVYTDDILGSGPQGHGLRAQIREELTGNPDKPETMEQWDLLNERLQKVITNNLPPSEE